MDPEVASSNLVLHPKTMEAWVSGRNHLSAKEVVLRGSKVRIFPFPQNARMVKWLTRRSAKPLLAGSNPAPGSIIWERSSVAEQRAVNPCVGSSILPVPAI